MIKQMTDLPDPTIQNNGTATGSTPVALQSSPTSQTTTHALTKEQEPIGSNEPVLEEIGQEISVAPELEKIGVLKTSETIVLPPDVRKMGVTAVGVGQPVVTTTVRVPLTDDQIIKGLHAQIISSIRWLAEWCIRQLKKGHIHLKTIKGKIVREIGNT